MFGYALRRLILAIPLLIGITFVSFLVIHLAPGEPVENQSGESSTQSDAKLRERLREIYGLDKPLHVQYWSWLTRLARLDFGRSFSPDARPVLQKIGERLPVTLLLNIVEMMVIVVLAIPIGVLSATRQYSRFDKVTTIFVFVGFATPDFWLALMLMILFGVQLGWLPISGLRSPTWEYLSFWQQQWDFVAHLALPILVATFGGLAGFSRYMRQSMLEVIRQDYIQSARAKGAAGALGARQPCAAQRAAPHRAGAGALAAGPDGGQGDGGVDLPHPGQGTAQGPGGVRARLPRDQGDPRHRGVALEHRL